MSKRVARRAGLDPRGFSPHKLRHSFATWLRRKGVALDVIREVLGHSSKTTQIYARVGNEELEAALRKFPNVMLVFRKLRAPVVTSQQGVSW